MRFIAILAFGVLTACQTVPEGGQWVEDELAGCLVWVSKPVPGETANWDGPCVDGRAHGAGTLTLNYWKDGENQSDRYVGELEYGKVAGEGTYYFASGDRYIGELRDGKKHGRGEYIWANGNRFVGSFVNDEPTGYASLISPDGDRYEGEIAGDAPNGLGTYWWATGERYEGQFKDGQPYGQGV